MKRMFRGTAIILTAVLSMNVLAGCHGSYTLFHKVLKWNGTIGDKWVRSVVHFLMWLVPVYGICFFVDLVGLNTIEFWTGSNPLAMNPGDKEQQVVAYNNDLYRITATKNRFDVIRITGQKAGEAVALVYHDDLNTWNVESEGTDKVVARIDQNDPAVMYLIHPDGHEEPVNVNE